MRVRIALLASVVVAVGCVGVALAAVNRVHVITPSDAKVDRAYSITIKGEAALPERLYLFLDYHTCGRTPAIEHRRANGDIWNLFGGRFKKTARGWRSNLRGVDHACVYLQDLTARVNGSGGILARSFAAFVIH